MAKGDKNKKIRSEVLKKYNGKCAYCGVDVTNEMHIDHIVPRRRGDKDSYLKLFGIERGMNTLENYNPSCPSCNISKSTFTLDQWRNEINKKYDRLIRDSSSFRFMIRTKIVRKNNKVFKFYFETL